MPVSFRVTRRAAMKTWTSLVLAVVCVGGALGAAVRAAEPAKNDAQPARAKPAATSKAEKPLKILILGGTGFLGPQLTDAAEARGHEVTTFNRGVTEKKKVGYLPEVTKKLYGNRDPKLRADGTPADQPGDDETNPAGLSQLKGKTFDAVIDTSGYFPRIVKASAELLAPNVKQYVFISTISVYDNREGDITDESAPLGKMEDPTIEDMGSQMQYYGPLKALCEQAAEAAMPGRVLNIRPGFIVGPDDSTDRFTYWPWRAAQGGEMLVPGSPDDPVQFIDVRDLSEWTIRCIENNTVGIFNATGTEKPHRWGDVIDACIAASPNKPTPVWVSTEWMLSQQDPRLQCPIWVPPVAEYKNFHRTNVSKAVKAGLTFRPVSETVRATMDWLPREMKRRADQTVKIKADAKAAGKPEPRMADPTKLRAGLDPKIEQDAIKRWKADQQKPAEKPKDKPEDKSGAEPAKK